MPSPLWTIEVSMNKGKELKSDEIVFASGNPDHAIDYIAELNCMGDIVHHTLNGHLIFDHGEIRISRYTQEKD